MCIRDSFQADKSTLILWQMIHPRSILGFETKLIRNYFLLPNTSMFELYCYLTSPRKVADTSTILYYEMWRIWKLRWSRKKFLGNETNIDSSSARSLEKGGMHKVHLTRDMYIPTIFITKVKVLFEWGIICHTFCSQNKQKAPRFSIFVFRVRNTSKWKSEHI